MTGSALGKADALSKHRCTAYAYIMVHNHVDIAEYQLPAACSVHQKPSFSVRAETGKEPMRGIWPMKSAHARKKISLTVKIWRDDCDPSTLTMITASPNALRADEMPKARGSSLTTVEFAEDLLPEEVSRIISPCDWGDGSLEWERRNDDCLWRRQERRCRSPAATDWVFFSLNAGLCLEKCYYNDYGN